MSRYTKKVQVALTEEQYRDLSSIAAREHKKIGVVVREALEQTCFAAQQRQRIRQAASELLELAKTADAAPPADSALLAGRTPRAADRAPVPEHEPAD